jgi:hypothetical protein
MSEPVASDDVDPRGRRLRRASHHTGRNLAVLVACAIAVPTIVFVGSSTPGASGAPAPSTLAPLATETATDDAASPEAPTPPESTTVEPDPVEPDPVEPTVVEPIVPEPDPVEPTVLESDPVEPTVVEPDPVEPIVPEPDGELLVTVSSAEAAAMRVELDAYLVELLEVVDDYESTLRADAPASLRDSDYSGAVATARGLMAGLDDNQVQAMHQIVDTPMWAEQPDRLQHVVDVSPFNGDGVAAVGGYGLRSAATTTETVGRVDAVPATLLGPFTADAGDPAGLLSDCQTSAQGVRSLFIAYWAAAQVAGAAGAFASGLPNEGMWVALLVVAAVVFGVANGLAIAFGYDLTLALDCLDAKSNAERERSLPVEQPVTEPPVYTPGSTQTSIDVLISIVGGIQTKLEIIEGNVVAQLDRQLEVINALGLAQASASYIRDTAADTQDRTTDLLERIGPADDTTDTANGLANTIEDRLDTILQNTADFRALSLRLSIERNLADPEHVPVGLFTLPAELGGELETVRELVAVVIDDLEAAGQRTGNAQAVLATANASFAAGNFARAYTEYAMAYRAAVR